jgi:Pro-kumamolisin, activation domain/Subtilase family
MQRFGRPLISILGSKSGPIICAIVLIASLEKGSPARAQSVATRTTFTDSIKEPANVTVNGAVNKNAPTVVRSQLTDAESQATIDFSIALKMRDFAELQQRIGMHEIIPLEEMRAKYFPASADVDSLRKWLIAQGFEVQPAAQYELSVFARGTVAQLQRVFGVTFARVQFRGEEHTSAVTAPSLPAVVAGLVLSINGLQPHLHPFPHSVRKAISPGESIQNQPPYLVSEIESAYGASAGNGAGQKIGIVIDTFPKNSDLTAFWADNGVPQSLSNIEKVQVVAGTLPAPSGEETLDTSWSSGIASGAKIRIYAVADSNLPFSKLDQAYQRIINDLPSQPELHQISMSYGLGELYESSGQLETDDAYFATIAANGVTLFASSGDGGSSPDSNGNYGGPVQVENPASDPNVIAVGGTSLYLNSNGTVSREFAWTGSGGGQSVVFARPTWQPGASTIAGGGRLVPDVALDADPNTGVFLVVNGSTAYEYGGTSLSAPVWAGVCARVNQVRAGNGAPSLGPLGPKIYSLLGSSSFRDITSGSNGAYSAGPGFDLCTGIGVPEVDNLINALPGKLPQGSGIAKDFNNDGFADLVWEQSATGQRLIWFMSKGVPVSSAGLGPVDPSWHIAGAGDFLGNGQSDLVWERTNGQHLIWIFLAGVPQYAITLQTLAGGWHIVGAGDFNGDGQADLVWENSVTGERVIWLMNHGSSTSAIFLPTVDPSWHIAGVGDFLGNKQNDLVWENKVNGSRIIWLMNNGTPTTAITLPTVDPSWHIGGAGDFLGTGQASLVWENTITGQRLIWVFKNGQPTSAIGLPTVPADWHIVDH